MYFPVMHKNVYTFFQSVQVKIELGHRASQRESPSPDGYTHDWTVYVRGPEGCNIAHFIEKVVFHLHQRTNFVLVTQYTQVFGLYRLN
jgi:transcription initiation factor IIF auxiliary subunit